MFKTALCEIHAHIESLFQITLHWQTANRLRSIKVQECGSTSSKQKLIVVRVVSCTRSPVPELLELKQRRVRFPEVPDACHGISATRNHRVQLVRIVINLQTQIFVCEQAERVFAASPVHCYYVTLNTVSQRVLIMRVQPCATIFAFLYGLHSSHLEIVNLHLITVRNQHIWTRFAFLPLQTMC